MRELNQIRLLGAVMFLAFFLAPSKWATAASLEERFETLTQGYQKRLLEDGVAADSARTNLLKKYDEALTRLRAEDQRVAGHPLIEAAVDAELASVRARLAGEEPVIKRADPPSFVLPETESDWLEAEGEEVKIDMGEVETRFGKPIGIEVKKGDRVRVIPNPVDKIERGSLSGDWRGIDRGWIGIRIHEQTATSHLASIGKKDFIYTASCDGELAVYVYLWDMRGEGEFRIKFRNLDARDDSPEAKPPTSFLNLKKKADQLLEAADEKARRARVKSLEVYSSALRQLARDAKATQDPLTSEIEEEIAMVGAGGGSSLIYESTPFRRPRNAAEWEAQAGKLVVVEAADNDWRGSNGKRVGIKVSKGDKVRLVVHPADLWGRTNWSIGTWNGADRCSLRVGIVGRTGFKGVASGSSESGAIYECKADGQLAFKTEVWATSGGFGKLRIKVQPLAKDPAGS